jgi:hypothetical protein
MEISELELTTFLFEVRTETPRAFGDFGMGKDVLSYCGSYRSLSRITNQLS